MKRFFCMIIITSVLLSALTPFAVFADDDRVTVNGMTFEKNSWNNTCMLVETDENLAGDVVIPGTVKFGSEDLPVSEIWMENFQGNNITSLTFPDGNISFYGDYLDIKESYGPLASCKSLKRVVMGKGNSIYSWLFSSCESLEEVVIPEGVEFVDINAFWGCKNLKSVTLPSTVLGIDVDFYVGRKYGHILDNNVSTEIKIDKNNPNFVVSGGVIFSKDMTELVYYPNLEQANYTVPSSVKKICSGAFSGCNNLKTLTIGENVEVINYAFGACDNLTAINVDKNNKYFISVDGILYSKDMKRLIQYPFSKPGYYYEVPDTVTVIDCFTMHRINKSQLKGISLPENVDCLIREGNLLSVELNTPYPDHYCSCYAAKNAIITTDVETLFGGEIGSLFSKIETVFYTGTEQQWEELKSADIETYRDTISESAKIVFNYVFQRGDCTGDGEIDNKDVVVTFRFASGEDTNAIIKAMNVNGDSSVDNKDVVSLFRYVSTK